MTTGVQEQYAPTSRCFGCGPANARGLRIKSVEGGDGVLVAEFTPEEHHLAFDGVLNGGIVGTLLDCHANWTAAMALMREKKLEAPPCTVTAEYAVKLRKPTPLTRLTLRAQPSEVQGDRCVVDATLAHSDSVTASLRGVFVAVKPGHPAYHRW